MDDYYDNLEGFCDVCHEEEINCRCFDDNLFEWERLHDEIHRTMLEYDNDFGNY